MNTAMLLRYWSLQFLFLCVYCPGNSWNVCYSLRPLCHCKCREGNRTMVMDKLKKMMHQKEGKLTGELALESSSLGLGKLPRRLSPDRITGMICGYCSTGCSLDVHMRKGKAVNLTPTRNYPVNIGAACPKGWEALTPLQSKDRAVTPYLRDGHGRLKPIDWDAALRAFVDRFKNIQNKYGKESVAFISTGQIPTEEMALLG